MERIFIVSIEELAEKGRDIPRNGCSMEKKAELRDIISRLPEEIVRIGIKRVEGYPLTPTERKRLERYRKHYRNGENEDIF